MDSKCFIKLQELYKTQIENGQISPQQIKDVLTKAEELRSSGEYAKDFKKLREKSAHEIMGRLEYKASMISSRLRLDSLRKTEGIRPGTNDVFKALGYGLDKVVKGGNDTFFRAKENFIGRVMGRLDGIRKELTTDFLNGDNDVQIAKAMWDQKAGKSIDGYPEAIRKAAQYFVGHNQKIIQELRDMGVNIQERQDYLFRQVHNPEKVASVPKEKWVEAITKRFDPEKSFDIPTWDAKAKKKLGKLYDDIRDGTFENSVGMFGGSRTLVANGPEDLVLYNQEFGNGSIFDTIVATANSSSKAAAAGRTIGIPENWEWLEKQTLADIKDPKEREAFMSTKVGILGQGMGAKAERDIMFKEMFGYERVPDADIIGKTYRTLSLTQAAARLPLAFFSTFGDFAGAAWGMRSATGAVFPEFAMFRNFFQAIHPEDRDIMSKHLELHLSDLVSETYDRMGTFSQTRKGNPLAWIQRQTLKLNGLEFQNVGSKLSTARFFAERMAANGSKSWAELPPQLTNTMTRFNIGEKEWNIMRPLRQEIALKTGDPMFLITPESIREIGHTDLGNRYGSMLQDMGRSYLMETQAREKGIIGHGKSYSDPLGAFFRLATQFQGTALSVDRVFRKIGLNDQNFKANELFSREAFKEAWQTGNANHLKMVAGAAAQVTIFTAVGMALKDLAKNKEPEIDQKFFADAFIKGSVPLITGYGLDILRGQFTRNEDGFKQDLLERLAGPTFSQVKSGAELIGLSVQDGVEAIESLVKGETFMHSKAGLPATKFLMHNFPALLGPAWPVVQKAIMEEINDYWNPGYSGRMARRAYKRGERKLVNLGE